MINIYLVRHGEVNNPKDLWYGRLPRFGMTKNGEKQVKELQKYFAKTKIKHIYASPLLRTRKTAQIIAGGKIPISYSDELLEANYKKWQGVPYHERDKLLAEEYFKDPVRVSAMLGESVWTVQKRMVDEIYKILQKHPHEDVLIVSHADPIIAARLYFEGRPLNELTNVRTRHASITTLKFDNKLECKQVEYKEIVKSRESKAYEGRNLA